MRNLYLSMLRFIADNQSRLILLLLVAAALSFLEKFPYINTFLAFPYPWNSFLILFLLTVGLFGLNELFSFRLALMFLGIAAVLSVFGKETIAQTVGTIIYSLMWFGLIQMVVGRAHWNKKA